MIHFTFLDPRCSYDHLGYLPGFLDELDPRPARQQIDQNYQHGGGWQPLDGWVMNPRTRRIKFPGDPPLAPLAAARLHDEMLYFYDHAWLLVLQPDGSYEVARVD
jgi:hypothetical protein